MGFEPGSSDPDSPRSSHHAKGVDFSHYSGKIAISIRTREQNIYQSVNFCSGERNPPRNQCLDFYFPISITHSLTVPALRPLFYVLRQFALSGHHQPRTLHAQNTRPELAWSAGALRRNGVKGELRGNGGRAVRRLQLLHRAHLRAHQSTGQGPRWPAHSHAAALASHQLLGHSYTGPLEHTASSA